MKHTFLLLIGILACGAAFSQENLTYGTPIPVMILNDVTSEKKDNINAIIMNDVKGRDGTIVLAKGTPVLAQAKRTKLRRVGRPGQVELKIISTTSTDGQTIMLSGASEDEGEDNRGKVLGIGLGLGLTILWPMLFYLLKKGEKAIIPANTILPGVQVMGNYTILGE